MTSPDSSNVLLAAVRTKLLGTAEIAAIVGDRIFDRPAQSVDFPYIQLGETQVLPFEAICVTGVQVYFTVDVWVRDGWAGDTCRDLCSLIFAALHVQPLDLGVDHRLQTIEHQNTLVLRDPDGSTRHGVIQFRADTTIDA